ncbi:methanesulfonate monooxygenase [Pyrenophora seminiperda CCB06]|uniref:Methanesulfonate monooxygenase n=1 Tax=Pyrenophora seminiperda CCB06 TaxID=1302712 RepID=A0A3M7LZQ0_9PLEO|nr:methanesulfonate monooxygenase [Pyrenophora seminiperda CCB06]
MTITDDTNNGTSSELGYTPAEPLPINSDPKRVLFAYVKNPNSTYTHTLKSPPLKNNNRYWVPNVSGGLVISQIPQKTSWDLPSNIRYARTAEAHGFEYALTQIRFTAAYGAAHQHESITLSQALLHHTMRLKVIAAILPGPLTPVVVAKQIASIDNYTNGRVAVNIVSGWNKSEFTAIGEWWLEHAERYRRSNEFIQCLRGIWTAGEEGEGEGAQGFSFSGDFYRFHNYKLNPKPLQKPHPEIFQGGNSDDARNNGAEVSDWYFMNGNDLEGFREQIADVKARAVKAGRGPDAVRFAVNGFVIVRDTEEEAFHVLRDIQGKADTAAVSAFASAVKQAGASTSNKRGMWADSKAADLVQYNDGFKTKLIGTKEQVADRILLLKSLGVGLVLTAFLHYEEEVEQFGREVLPLVRRLEGEGRGRDVDDEVERSGWVYEK